MLPGIITVYFNKCCNHADYSVLGLSDLCTLLGFCLYYLGCNSSFNSKCGLFYAESFSLKFDSVLCFSLVDINHHTYLSLIHIQGLWNSGSNPVPGKLTSHFIDLSIWILGGLIRSLLSLCLPISAANYRATQLIISLVLIEILFLNTKDFIHAVGQFDSSFFKTCITSS